MPKKPTKKRDDFVPATGEYINIKFEDIIKILTMINAYGQLDELAKVVKGEKVRIPSQAINKVKEHIADHPEMSRDPIGKRVLRPAGKKAAANREAMAETETSLEKAPRAVQRGYCCSFDAGG